MSIDRRPFLVLAGLGLALSLALEVLHARAYLLPTASSFCAIGSMSSVRMRVAKRD